MDFFTADQHFGHANMLKFEPLRAEAWKDVDEMNEGLVWHWNNVVHAGDTVYQLGDFTLGGEDVAYKWFRCLNGRIMVLPGGHDHRWLKHTYPSGIVSRLYDSRVKSATGDEIIVLPPLVSLEYPEYGTKERPQVLVLCHYAMRVWDRSHYGSWHLHGHSHGHLVTTPWGFSMDVGVDNPLFVWAPAPIKQLATMFADWKKLGVYNFNQLEVSG